MAPAPEN